MKHHVSTNENVEGANSTEIKNAGNGKAMLARYEQKKQARLVAQKRRKKYYRFMRRIGFAIIVAWIIGELILNGYSVLKNTAGREIAMMRFEQALKRKDVAALQTYIRIPGEAFPVNETTLQPLFTYLDKHPQAYETLERDFDKQRKMKHVYIKGLTSKPPVFTIKVYENRYVFEPTLYFLKIRLDEADDLMLVNGKKVQGEATKDPFVKKVGPYLPGTYTVTSVEDGEKRKKQTKQVILFGGARVYEVDLTKE